MGLRLCIAELVRVVWMPTPAPDSFKGRSELRTLVQIAAGLRRLRVRKEVEQDGALRDQLGGSLQGPRKSNGKARTARTTAFRLQTSYSNRWVDFASA